MTTAQQKLDNLTEALVEDILNTPDDEILAEAKEDGIDLDALREQMLSAVGISDKTRSGLTPIGKYLRSFRMERGIRLLDMADKLGIPCHMLSGIEVGRHPMPQTFAGDIICAYGLIDAADLMEAARKTIEQQSFAADRETCVAVDVGGEDYTVLTVVRDGVVVVNEKTKCPPDLISAIATAITADNEDITSPAARCAAHAAVEAIEAASDE